MRQLRMYEIYQERCGEIDQPDVDEVDRFDLIYRRFNKAADQAAGVAAELVTEYEENAQPHTTDMFRVGTNRTSREGGQGSMAWTDYIRQAMDMEREGSPREIWLPEK